jgi:hypothetical protein
VRHRQRVEGSGRIEMATRSGDLWCCAELWAAGAPGLLALTSPVYMATSESV